MTHAIPRSRRAAPLCALAALLALSVVAQAAPDVPDVPGVPGVPAEAYDCLIEPRTTAQLGSPTRGVVARVLVDRGDAVVTGQPIVELESAIERAILAQAQARAAMRSEVITREADLELARQDSERFTDLHARKLAPAQQRDEAQSREHVAAAALAQALENRALVALELQRARRDLDRRTVRSPVDGVVVERLVQAGELVTDNPIATIAELDSLRVEVVLPSRLFGSLGKGDTAQLYLEFSGGMPVPATVEVVDQLLDTRSGTFGVRLGVSNPNRSIAAGQRCRVAFGDDPEAGGVLGAARPVGTEAAPPAAGQAGSEGVR